MMFGIAIGEKGSPISREDGDAAMEVRRQRRVQRAIESQRSQLDETTVTGSDVAGDPTNGSDLDEQHSLGERGLSPESS